MNPVNNVSKNIQQSKNQKINNSLPQTQPENTISPMGKKVIWGGIALVIIGFFVLTKTDPYGQNLASKVSPFLILGGYAMIGLGIIYPKKDS